MITEDSGKGRNNSCRGQKIMHAICLRRFASRVEKKRNNQVKQRLLLTVMACCALLLTQGQPVIKNSIDRSEILIGEQFKLAIEASSLTGEYRINWPVIPDSIPHFEVVGNSRFDTLYSDKQMTAIVQTTTFTSFDSGKWVLPSFPGIVVPLNAKTAYSFFTDSMPVTVSFSVSDTSSLLKDIKPIREVKTVSSWWYWIIGGMLLATLVIVVLWYFRKRKKNNLPLSFQSNLSPYDEAIEELEKLRSADLSKPVDIKMVHTRLAEILKRYLSRRQNNNFLNKTTGDLLLLLQDQGGDKNMLAKAAGSLRCADAVKFAKYLPPVHESEQNMQEIKEVIETIQQLSHQEKSKPKTAG